MPTLRVACPMKAYVSYVVWCEPYQKIESSKGDFIILYPVYKCKLPFALVTRRYMREMGEEIDFIERLPHFTLIHLVTDNLSLGSFKKKEATPPP